MAVNTRFIICDDPKEVGIAVKEYKFSENSFYRFKNEFEMAAAMINNTILLYLLLPMELLNQVKA